MSDEATITDKQQNNIESPSKNNAVLSNTSMQVLFPLVSPEAQQTEPMPPCIAENAPIIISSRLHALRESIEQPSQKQELNHSDLQHSYLPNTTPFNELSQSALAKSAQANTLQISGNNSRINNNRQPSSQQSAAVPAVSGQEESNTLESYLNKIKSKRRSSQMQQQEEPPFQLQTHHGNPPSANLQSNSRNASNHIVKVNDYEEDNNEQIGEALVEGGEINPTNVEQQQQQQQAFEGDSKNASGVKAHQQNFKLDFSSFNSNKNPQQQQQNQQQSQQQQQHQSSKRSENDALNTAGTTANTGATTAHSVGGLANSQQPTQQPPFVISSKVAVAQQAQQAGSAAPAFHRIKRPSRLLENQLQQQQQQNLQYQQQYETTEVESDCNSKDPSPKGGVGRNNFRTAVQTGTHRSISEVNSQNGGGQVIHQKLLIAGPINNANVTLGGGGVRLKSATSQASNVSISSNPNKKNKKLGMPHHHSTYTHENIESECNESADYSAISSYVTNNAFSEHVHLNQLYSEKDPLQHVGPMQGTSTRSKDGEAKNLYSFRTYSVDLKSKQQRKLVDNSKNPSQHLHLPSTAGAVGGNTSKPIKQQPSVVAVGDAMGYVSEFNSRTGQSHLLSKPPMSSSYASHTEGFSASKSGKDNSQSYAAQLRQSFGQSPYLDNRIFNFKTRQATEADESLEKPGKVAASELKRQIRQLTHELEGEKNRTSDTIAKIKAFRQKNLGKIDKTVKANSTNELQTELDHIEAKMKAMKKKNKQKDEDVADMKAQLLLSKDLFDENSRQNMVIQDQQVNINALHVTMETKDKSIEELHRVLSSSNNDIQQQITQIPPFISRLDIIFDSLVTENRSLFSENAVLKGRLDEKQGFIERLEQQIKVTSARNHELNRVHTELQQAKQELKQIDVLKGELTEKDTLIAHLKKDLLSAQNQCDKVRDDLREAENQANQFRIETERGHAETASAKLQIELAEKATELANEQTRVLTEVLASERAQREKEIAAQIEISESDDRYELKVSNIQLKERAVIMQRQLDEYAKQIDGLNRKVIEYQQTIDANHNGDLQQYLGRKSTQKQWQQQSSQQSSQATLQQQDSQQQFQQLSSTMGLMRRQSNKVIEETSSVASSGTGQKKQKMSSTERRARTMRDDDDRSVGSLRRIESNSQSLDIPVSSRINAATYDVQSQQQQQQSRNSSAVRIQQLVAPTVPISSMKHLTAEQFTQSQLNQPKQSSRFKDWRTSQTLTNNPSLSILSQTEDLQAQKAFIS